MIEKQVILKINNVYTANAFQDRGSWFIGAGSETDPVVELFDLSKGHADRLPDCPGGMMSFLPVPGQPDSFVSIMGLFPPFIGKDAGLYLHEHSEGGWKTVKALDLPFAHRCEFYRVKGETFLLAATVSRHKENPSDWSLPGELHVIHMGPGVSPPWKSKPAAFRLIRNHGMTRARIGGQEKICISGKEGIFAMELKDGAEWNGQLIFPGEVSEMGFIDLDGDGIDELVTIEPFHGDTLNFYKKRGAQWQKVYSDSLSFGHGLSAGIMNGTPVVVAGNRKGSLALETFTVNDLYKGHINRLVIEENVGPTQTQVFSVNGKEYLLSANQRKNEVALYSGRPD
jgi:hypothetical protein